MGTVTAACLKSGRNPRDRLTVQGAGFITYLVKAVSRLDGYRRNCVNGVRTPKCCPGILGGVPELVPQLEGGGHCRSVRTERRSSGRHPDAGFAMSLRAPLLPTEDWPALLVLAKCIRRQA